MDLTKFSKYNNVYGIKFYTNDKLTDRISLC